MESAEALVNQLGWPHMYHLFALLCLVTIAFKVTVLYLQRRDMLHNFKTFPGPPAHWLFGHVKEFKEDGKALDRIVEWGKQYSYTVPVWSGPCVCFLNIQHPDYMKTVYATTKAKDELGYKFIESWIGEGLLVSKGERWFRNRRLLTPGFHYDVLKPYTNLMADSAKIMLDKWESYANTGESFELFEHVSLVTLDTILKCAFSYSSNCQTEGGSNAYIKAVYELSYLINLRFRTFPYHNDLIFYLSPHGFRYRKSCRVAHDHTEAIIKRKEELKEEKELDRIQTKRNLDFLDILL